MKVEKPIPHLRINAKSEQSCPIYILPTDPLKLVFGFVGDKEHRFVDGTSDRFRKVYLDSVGNDKFANISSVAKSLSRAKIFLGNRIILSIKWIYTAARIGRIYYN